MTKPTSGANRKRCNLSTLEVANHFNRSEWYVVKLWQLWEDKQSMALMARDTKINYREISQIINAIKTQIKEKYNEYDD